jgi:hypothetical protein
MLAGILIEPPPSLPCANGSSPAATANRGAAAGAAGQQRRVPGAARRADQVVVGVAGEAELGGVGLAEADRAGPLQPEHHLVGHRRDVAGHRGGAELGDDSGRRVEVLDGGRHAVQRRGRVADTVGREQRLLAGELVGDGDERTHGVGEPPDPVEVVVDEVDR